MRARDFHVKLHPDFISCQITAGSANLHPPQNTDNDVVPQHSMNNARDTASVFDLNQC